jgi:MSHA pilin protein MshD
MSSRRTAGFSLIEVVVFIVVVGIAFVGMVLLYSRVTQASVDPLIRKQALALAASLLEEVELRAYTLCDPDDPAVTTATVPGDCATQEGIGVEGGETRYNAANRFDNVSDYDGFSMGSGVAPPNHEIKTVDGVTVIPGLSSYRLDVSVATIAANELGATIPGPPNPEALRVTVTATHVPTGVVVSLQGYRTRYAPNSP